MMQKRMTADTVDTVVPLHHPSPPLYPLRSLMRQRQRWKQRQVEVEVEVG